MNTGLPQHLAPYWAALFARVMAQSGGHAGCWLAHAAADSEDGNPILQLVNRQRQAEQANWARVNAALPAA